MSTLWDIKSTPLKKSFFTLLLGSVLFSACKKADLGDELDGSILPQPIALPVPCISQTANPAGRSYDTDSLQSYTCKDKHCGLLPLSNKNYWIYQDSVFTDGVFSSIQYDTLRFSSNIKSLTDGLTWWGSAVFVGIPSVLYSNDSALFALRDQLHNPEMKDAKRDFFLFEGDSVRYLSGFDDIAANGRSLKISGTIRVPAGEFNDYLYFEKHARNFRKDQVFFKPGVGVLRYVQEKAPFGERVIKLQHIKTLIGYHIE